MAASSTFLSSTTQFIPTSKFTHSQPSIPSPTSVAFRQLPRISASYAATAERTATTCPQIAANSSMYDILGIHVGATLQEIKSAYRKLARVSHPDVAGREDTSAADDFIRIHAAYATLSDPGKRADYDRALFRQQQRPAAMPSSRFSGYRGRSWETDQCW